MIVSIHTLENNTYLFYNMYVGAATVGDLHTSIAHISSLSITEPAI